MALGFEKVVLAGLGRLVRLMTLEMTLKWTQIPGRDAKLQPLPHPIIVLVPSYSCAIMHPKALKRGLQGGEWLAR